MGEKVLFSLLVDLSLQDGSARVLQTSRYLAGCFYMDMTGLFKEQYRNSAPGAEAATATLQSVVNAGNNSQWLLLVRPQGILEVRLSS